MPEPVDLWPEFESRDLPDPPVRFLREQASFLGKRTNNVITAEVERASYPIAKSHFAYDFVIVAPSLNNYRHRLFSVVYPIGIYPIFVRSTEEALAHLAENEQTIVHFAKNLPFGYSRYVQIENPKELQTVVRAVFQSDHVRNLLGNLMAEVEEV